MEEFEDNQYPNLLEVDGILLTNCEGQRVAIGKGFDYEDIYDFVKAYIDENSSDQLAERLNLPDGHDFYKKLTNLTFEPEEQLKNSIMKAFNGNYIDQFPDYDFDYDRSETEREAEDEKYDRAAGK